MENSSNQSFWQFSDNLRLQTNTLANLSLNDSIWSTNYPPKRPAEDRRNFDFRNVDQMVNDNMKPISFSNEVWKSPSNDDAAAFLSGSNKFTNDGFPGYGSSGLNGGFNKGVYTNYSNTPSLANFNNNNNNNGYSKGKGFAVNNNNNVVMNGKVNKDDHHQGMGGYGGAKFGKKNKGNRESNKDSNGNGNGDTKSAVDKRFKTLPASEALPRNETIGGYIFVCNNDTMAENLKRELFGLPPRYRDSVRAITPGLPLFLYNYSTHQLHGIFEAASFGGTNIDPTAWEDKKNPGESRFPAQVRVITRKVCEPLEEDSFRPILHHYDGPKFRLELNVPEALSLLDIFAENDA